jgi:integral membrane sensor domain MASE1
VLLDESHTSTSGGEPAQGGAIALVMRAWRSLGARDWRLAAATYVAFVLLIVLWTFLTKLRPLAGVVWPFNALCVALVLRATRTPAAAGLIIAAETLGNLTASVVIWGYRPNWALFPLCAVAEIALIVWTGRRLGLAGEGKAGLRQTALFAMVAGVIAPALSGCFATIAEMTTGRPPVLAPLVYMFWWSSNSLGMLIFLPLGLGLTGDARARLASPRMRLEAVAATIAILISAAAIFSLQSSVWTLLIAPSLVFATFRFGVLGAAVANLLAAIVAIAATSGGWGPLAHLGHTSIIETAGLLQIFLCLGWFVSLPPAYLLESFAAELRTQQDRLVESQLLAADAQNRMLRYQLDPHFFFNTLNALSSLIQEGETAKADLMVVSLSAFLRHSLTQSPTDRIPLSEEIRAQERYLQIEQIRFGERLAWAARVSPEAEAVPVPCFILQPLVENAIKHGVATTLGPVRVELAARVHAGVLTVLVSDNGCAEGASPARLGVGLENVRRRLALLYGSTAELSVAKRRPCGFTAVIRIPVETRQGGSGD